MKIGQTYSRIASRCLEAWYPDMSREERLALLDRGNLEEIEALIGAKDSIETAAHTIRRELEQANVYLPLDYIDTVFWSQTPNDDLVDTQKGIFRHNISDAMKGEIAYKAIEAVHDHWVRWNSQKFFDEKRLDKRFMFLRVELIGLDEALKDYVFVEEILTLLCIRPEHQHLAKAYREHRQEFRQFYGLTDGNLPLVIARADYPALSGSIAATMSNPITAERIAKQAIEHGGKPSTW